MVAWSMITTSRLKISRRPRNSFAVSLSSLLSSRRSALPTVLLKGAFYDLLAATAFDGMPCLCRDVPQSRRTSHQHLAASLGNDWAIVDQRRKLQRDQMLHHESIQEAAFRRRQSQRLERLPLVGREIVIEFRAHDSSNRSGCLARVLPSRRERDATAMCRDFDG